MCKRCASDLGKTKLKDLASAEAFVRSVFNDEAGNDDGDDSDDASGEETDVEAGDDKEAVESDIDEDNAEDHCNDEGKRSTSNKKTAAQTVKGGLRNAVLYGLFPGAIPEELSDLTYVEVSMISLINSLTKLHMCKKEAYFKASSPTYTVMNNVNSITSQFPRKLTSGDVAVLRTVGGVVPKDYTFRPFNVIRALRWLKENNRLYQTITIEIPDEWRGPDDLLIEEPIPVATIDLDEEDTAAVEEGLDASGVDHANHAAHEAGETATDLLLMSEFDHLSSMDILQEALEEKVDNGDDEPTAVDDLVAHVVERGGQAEFTDAMKVEALLEMSFPQYFPYGRGGPADPLSKWATLSRAAKVGKFAKFALSSGEHGRRFQNDFNFLSLCYYTCIRKRMGGKCQC